MITTNRKRRFILCVRFQKYSKLYKIYFNSLWASNIIKAQFLKILFVIKLIGNEKIRYQKSSKIIFLKFRTTFFNNFKHDYRPVLDWRFFFDSKYVEKIVDSLMIFHFVIFFNGETLFIFFLITISVRKENSWNDADLACFVLKICHTETRWSYRYTFFLAIRKPPRRAQPSLSQFAYRQTD